MGNSSFRLAIVPLTTCTGCENAILDLGEGFISVLDDVEIVYAPVLMDAEIPKAVDVTFLTGSVRSSEDELQVKEWRSRSSLLVSFGSCACFGGIPGLANLMSVNDLVRGVYVNNLNVDNPDGVVPERDVPSLKDYVVPVHQLVNVDYMVPGCPPPAKFITDLFSSILSGEEFKLPSKNLCESCPLNTGEKKIVSIKRWGMDPFDPSKCFLEQGFLCLGPVTRSGCDARCIRAGFPCRGCLGVPEGVDDPAAEMISAFASSLSLDDVNLDDLKKLKDLSGMLYRFTLPSSTFKHRLERKCDDG